MNLLTLDMRCSRCGTRPNIRVFPSTRDKYAEAPRAEPVATWRCQKCGEVSVITARAYKRAL